MCKSIASECSAKTREAILDYLTPGRIRKGVGLALLVAVLGALGCWLAADGIPVLWGPMATASDKQAGRDLFEHEWTANDPLSHGDGLGPVFNATSCVACHFQGGCGGAGDNKHNATHYETAGPGQPAVPPAIRLRGYVVEAGRTERRTRG